MQEKNRAVGMDVGGEDAVGRGEGGALLVHWKNNSTDGEQIGVNKLSDIPIQDTVS